MSNLVKATSIVETFTTPNETATFTVEIEEFNKLIGADDVCGYGYDDVGIIIKVPVKFGSNKEYVEFNAAKDLGIDIRKSVHQGIQNLIARKVQEAFRQLTSVKQIVEE